MVVLFYFYLHYSDVNFNTNILWDNYTFDDKLTANQSSHNNIFE